MPDPYSYPIWPAEAANWSFAAFRLIGGSEIFNPHTIGECEGEHCPLHKPSDHHMELWPQKFLSDEYLLTRVCPHGIFHRDPDNIRDPRRTKLDSVTKCPTGTCDGCCQPVTFIGRMATENRPHPSPQAGGSIALHPNVVEAFSEARAQHAFLKMRDAIYENSLHAFGLAMDIQSSNWTTPEPISVDALLERLRTGPPLKDGEAKRYARSY